MHVVDDPGKEDADEQRYTAQAGEIGASNYAIRRRHPCFSIGVLSRGSCKDYSVHFESSVQLKVYLKSRGDFKYT